jgi:GMP reductase
MSNETEILSLLKSIDNRLQALEKGRFDFCNMLIQPALSKYTSRKEVNLLCNFEFPHSGKKASFIPVIASNMDTVGTFSMCKVLAKRQMFTTLHKHYTKEEVDAFCASLTDEDFEYFAISTGIGSADYDKMAAILADNPRIQYICVDVANGYMLRLNEFLAQMRESYPDKTIFVGNVVSGDRTKELLQWADVVKVGIGPGSVCTTRQEAGVGRSQALSVIECSKAAQEVGGYVISDGGCNNVGNISQAFVCGADMVMLGGMFSGTDEAEAEILTDKNGKKWLNFHGMSSAEAMEKHYKDFEERMNYRASEGRSIYVAYKGSADTIAQKILGGLRSTITYTGVSGLLDLRKAKYDILSSFNNGINENLAMLSNPQW